MTANKPYRPNVAALLMRPDGMVLIAERIDPRDAWQLPQGGVDRGETHEEAMWRELGEELGLKDPKASCSILGVAPPTRYDFPPNHDAPIAQKYAGQEQTLFLLEFHGNDDDFDLNAYKHPEFCNIRWTHPNEAVREMWSFKRHILVNALDALHAHVPLYDPTTTP